jgi:hypothetical protein
LGWLCANETAVVASNTADTAKSVFNVIAEISQADVSTTRRDDFGFT